MSRNYLICVYHLRAFFCNISLTRLYCIIDFINMSMWALLLPCRKQHWLVTSSPSSLYWIPSCILQLLLLPDAPSYLPLVRIQWHSLFVLTSFLSVCAISSRYYVGKSEIYPIAMHFAKHSAANALINGWKSVELCQAYILMSIYAVPARRWEEDRSWLYTGLAIRYAHINWPTGHWSSLSLPQHRDGSQSSPHLNL